MATTPVRDTSTSPSGCIRLMKALSLALEPVISKTNDSIVLSTTRARKMSAMRRDSTRLLPVPRTLTSASSRSTWAPSSVRSLTLWTGTRRPSWFLICSIIIGVPEVAMVWRSTVIAGSSARSGPKATSDQHHAFFGDRLGLVPRPEQHLIVGRARRDHREAVFLLVDAAVDDDRAGRGNHL